MRLFRRYCVGIVLVGILVVLGLLVTDRLKDHQARAVARPRGDAVVGVRQVRLSQTQVETQEATLRLADTNVGNTRLLAPFAGSTAGAPGSAPS